MSTARDLPSSDRSDAIDPGRLIEEHQAGIWRYLRALGCDPAEADDLTQETFLAVLQRPFANYSPTATAAYLRKVARNHFISARRRCGRLVYVEQVEQIDRKWTQLVSDDHGESLLAALQDCLESLTDRARKALLMRFRDRRPRVEIARALTITEHGAKNLMQRAKRQLRTCIEGKLS
jgi:RNA polymerase sigma-70 factor (ECF subfamily)